MFSSFYVGLKIERSRSISDLEFVARLIAKNYYNPTNYKNLEKESIKSVIESLNDPDSVFVSQEDYKKYTSVRNKQVLDFRVLTGNIDYIKIYEFDQSLVKKFNNLDQLNSVNNLILDLRGSPGGDTATTLYLADRFLSNGIIFIEKESDNQERSYKASRNSRFEEIPLVVLVDNLTASSAEILGAALQQNGRALLIGQNTYGKDTEQEWYELSDGSAVRLTVAHWFTPAHTSVKGSGITPDIKIVHQQNSGDDVYIQEAIRVLKNSP